MAEKGPNGQRTLPSPATARGHRSLSNGAHGPAQCRNTLAKAGNLHCQLQARRADAFQHLDDQIASARAANIKKALDDDDNARLLLMQEPR